MTFVDQESPSAGSALFRHPWRFVTEAPNMAALPPEGPPEVAFAGRSNVGKSSLINALSRQSNLARTSNTPGADAVAVLLRARPSGRRRRTPCRRSRSSTCRATASPRRRRASSRRGRSSSAPISRGRAPLKRVFLLVDCAARAEADRRAADGRARPRRRLLPDRAHQGRQGEARRSSRRSRRRRPRRSASAPAAHPDDPRRHRARRATASTRCAPRSPPSHRRR